MVTRRPHLTLIQGGRADEDRARVRLYPYATRRVRSEPKPPTRPLPPKAA